MKKLIIPFMLIGAALMASFTLQDTPLIKFDVMEHDFGNIPQGEPVTYEFKFTNAGSQVLILTDVKASCGCTTPKWPQEPIMPGQSATISAEYNAAADGVFDKTVTVYSNASNNKVELKLKGMVEKRTVDEGHEGTELKLGK